VPWWAWGAPTIRVALAIHASSFDVACPSGLEVVDASGGEILSGLSASFRADRSGIMVNGFPTDDDRVTLRSKGPFWVSKHRYRGILEIRKNENFIDAINLVDIEKYLYSVIGSEMSPSWPSEALKSQAVVARTYALKKKEERKALSFDVVSSFADQAYEGMGSETSATQSAAEITRGEVLYYQNALITAYYSADCGGKTEKGENVFPGPLPYLQSVICPYGSDSPYQHWTKSYSFYELSERLGRSIFGIALRKDLETDRAAEVKLDTGGGPMVLAGFLFRKLLGTRDLRSTQFDLTETKKTVLAPREEAISFEKKGLSVLSRFLVRVEKPFERPVMESVPEEKKVYLIHESGALSEGEVSRENPIVAISSGGILFPVHHPLWAISSSVRFFSQKFKIPNSLIHGGHKGLKWVPLEVPVSVTFWGKGWGHGVGLCQWGSRGMALIGKGYRDILHYYYKDIELRKIYD